jgi:hypothetical protein
MATGMGRNRGRLVQALAFVTLLALGAGCASRESAAPDASFSASSAPSQAASATASSSAAEALDADHIFDAAVAGYEFVEVPRSLERQARRDFQASSGLEEGEAQLDLRSLTRDGAGTSLVLVVTLSPEYAALPGTERGFVSGMAESAGTQPEEIDLGATEGYVVANAEQTIVAWQDGNLLVGVFADRRAPAVDASRAIAEATVDS